MYVSLKMSKFHYFFTAFWVYSRQTHLMNSFYRLSFLFFSLFPSLRVKKKLLWTRLLIWGCVLWSCIMPRPIHCSMCMQRCCRSCRLRSATCQPPFSAWAWTQAARSTSSERHRCLACGTHCHQVHMQQAQRWVVAGCSYKPSDTISTAAVLPAELMMIQQRKIFFQTVNQVNKNTI